MRKVTFGAAVSLDGYIARADHQVDWLVWNDEVAAITASYWATVDAVVMGRRTYEASLAAGTPSYPGVDNYVLSRTLQEAPDAAVRIVSDDATTFLRDLKSRHGGDICVIGGGVLGHSLLEAGLVDEVGVNVHPLLIGDGVPLFHPMAREIRLELLASTPLPGGCLYALYRVIA